MYLSYKDKKIQIQKKIISQLQEENKCLKEQLRQDSPKQANARLRLMAEAYEEYQILIKELNKLKSEYQTLIRDVKINQNKLLHTSEKRK